MAKKFRIIDSHVHFPVKKEELGKSKQEYLDEFGEEKWKKLQQMNKFQQDQWKKAWGFPDAVPPGDTVEETCQMWLDDLDKKGVEKVVFVTAGDFSQSNDNMARIVQFAPDRFIGYAVANPWFGEKAVVSLKKALESGLRAVYFDSSIQGFPINDFIGHLGLGKE